MVAGYGRPFKSSFVMSVVPDSHGRMRKKAPPAFLASEEELTKPGLPGKDRPSPRRHRMMTPAGNPLPETVNSRFDCPRKPSGRPLASRVRWPVQPVDPRRRYYPCRPWTPTMLCSGVCARVPRNNLTQPGPQRKMSIRKAGLALLVPGPGAARVWRTRDPETARLRDQTFARGPRCFHKMLRDQ